LLALPLFFPISVPNPGAFLLSNVFYVYVWAAEFSWSPCGVLVKAFPRRAMVIQDLAEFNPGIGI